MKSDQQVAEEMTSMTNGSSNRRASLIIDGVAFKKKRMGVSCPLVSFVAVCFVICLVATGVIVHFFFGRCEIIVSPTISKAPPFVVKSTTQTQVEASSPPPPLKVRLPTTIIPHSYQLNLTPFFYPNFTFHGTTTIVLNVTQPTNSITLHAQDLTIGPITLQDFNEQFLPIQSVRQEPKRQFLIIELNDFLSANQQYRLSIEFEGVLNDLLQGFYRSSYFENNETHWLAATQFQATDARRAFPCFDEPALKARFQINLSRPGNMSTISNMRRVSTSKDTKNKSYFCDHFEPTLPMSTYLIAFLISDFKNISNGGVFSIWARPSALSQANYSLQIGPKVLEFYEGFFGIKYPLPKLDMAAVPDFPAGAMENWGLITYREPVLLYEEGVSGRSTLPHIAHVVAHELAHQWFGNLVTPTWWTDLWLNEGFATYVEYLGAHEVQPKWKDLDLFLVNELHGSLSLDALRTSHQISIKVNNPDEVNDIFDRISYSKGASIIRMMQHFLSSKVFHEGLTEYLRKRAYKNADQDDLWAVLTEYSHLRAVLPKHVTVKQIMDTWTLQVGFPVVTVTRNYLNDTMTLKQDKFCLTEGTSSTLWWVPVTWTSKDNPSNRLIWLEQKPEIRDVPVGASPPNWVLINTNQTGYYRVNYDEKNWKLLIEQLKYRGHHKIDPKNRAQLLDDVLNLAFAGRVSYDLALNLTQYLRLEREFVPWKAALNNLDYLADMFERSMHFDKFKNFMQSLIQSFYNELGFKDTPLEPPLNTFSRIELLQRACELGVRTCLVKAVQQFQNWKNSAEPDKINAISPDLRGVIYCAAISAGGQEEWDFAWQRYLATNVANEKETLLSALGCSKEPWLLTRFLDWSISEGRSIRKHDVARVFASVSDNPIGMDITYRFLKTHWTRLRTYLGPSSMTISIIIRSATSKINTQLEIEDFRRFLHDKQEELGIAQRTAQQSLEQAEANRLWMDRYFAQIVLWLQNNT